MEKETPEQWLERKSDEMEAHMAKPGFLETVRDDLAAAATSKPVEAEKVTLKLPTGQKAALELPTGQTGAPEALSSRMYAESEWLSRMYEESKVQFDQRVLAGAMTHLYTAMKYKESIATESVLRELVANAYDNLNDLPLNDDWIRQWSERAKAALEVEPLPSELEALRRVADAAGALLNKLPSAKAYREEYLQACHAVSAYEVLHKPVA